MPATYSPAPAGALVHTSKRSQARPPSASVTAVKVTRAPIQSPAHERASFANARRASAPTRRPPPTKLQPGPRSHSVLTTAAKRGATACTGKNADATIKQLAVRLNQSAAAGACDDGGAAPGLASPRICIFARGTCGICPAVNRTPSRARSLYLADAPVGRGPEHNCAADVSVRLRSLRTEVRSSDVLPLTLGFVHWRRCPAP